MYIGYCNIEQLLTEPGSESTDFCSRHVDVQAFAELLAIASQLACNAHSRRHICKDIVGQLAEMCD